MGDKKLKLLYLAKYLEEETDQEHPAGMPELLAYLTANGISAERKSVYDDLRLLESFGMDIETVKGRQFGYYLGERTFQLPEVKLLVDAVQAAPFLTQKKSMELIGKLGNTFKHRYQNDLLLCIMVFCGVGVFSRDHCVGVLYRFFIPRHTAIYLLYNLDRPCHNLASDAAF